MGIPGNLLTTAMAVMPHRDVDRALDMALSLDVPFWLQLARLKRINSNAFMFIDEPGLQFVFSGISGYGNVAARQDMETFFAMIERPGGVHLCGNPDWDFLLGLDLDVLSLDVYTNGEVFSSYARSIRRFLDRGGTLVWGVVPTNFEPFEREGIDSLEKHPEAIWSALDRSGIDREYLLSRSMISPATCCLVNPDGERTVEKAFRTVKSLSERLRSQYGLA